MIPIGSIVLHSTVPLWEALKNAIQPCDSSADLPSTAVRHTKYLTPFFSLEEKRSYRTSLCGSVPQQVAPLSVKLNSVADGVGVGVVRASALAAHLPVLSRSCIQLPAAPCLWYLMDSIALEHFEIAPRMSLGKQHFHFTYASSIKFKNYSPYC